MRVMERPKSERNIWNDFAGKLHESHEVCVYEAIERLVQAGAEVGYSAGDLIHMLDRGMTLEQMFDLIESKMPPVQAA
jgi:hypothetical protein